MGNVSAISYQIHAQDDADSVECRLYPRAGHGAYGGVDPWEFAAQEADLQAYLQMVRAEATNQSGIRLLQDGQPQELGLMTGEMDTLQVLSAMEQMQPARAAEHSGGYLEFSFLEQPRELFLWYIDQNHWQDAYPMDGNRLKLPEEKGIYSFSLDLTWEDGQSATAYFSVYIGDIPALQLPYTAGSAELAGMAVPLSVRP